MYLSLDIVLAVVSMFVYVLGPIIPGYFDYSRLLWITEDSLVI